MSNLVLPSSVHPIIVKERTSPWFDLYNYCVKFKLNEAGALRKLDHKSIDLIIESRRNWGKRVQAYSGPGSWKHRWINFTIEDSDVETLHHMCDFLLTNPHPRRMVISGNFVYIYTSATELINEICRLSFINSYSIRVTRLNLTGIPNTIKLKKSNYQYRSYFRGLKLDPNIATNIKSFLLVQKEIRLSPSLQYWIKHGINSYNYEHFFIDHNELGIVSMLSLFNPRLIRKTMPIIISE